jgi:hypothetical protein
MRSRTGARVNGYAPGAYWKPWERFRFYYPGDDYIDWLGLSIYSEPDFNGAPRTLNTDQRRHSSPAHTSAPPVTAARRLLALPRPSRSDPAATFPASAHRRQRAMRPHVLWPGR